MKLQQLLTKLGLVLVLGVAIMAINGCGSDEESDRTEFLIYYGSALDQRMDQLAQSCRELLAQTNKLEASPTEENLRDTWQSYLDAMLIWQSTNFINFGPGAKDGLRLTLQEELALWPLNESVIELKIENQEFALNDSWRNSRGFMTIEYLLYAENDVGATLAALTSERMSYLTAITSKLNDQATYFNNGWNDVFITEFIANNGTDVTSSTTVMYNEWLRSYELLKNMKLIEPLGLKAGQIEIEPDLVESPYAGYSLDYAKAHFNSIVEIYIGSDMVGWDDYLRSVKGGDELVDNTLAQIAAVRAAFEAVPNDTTMKALIEQEHPTLINLQKEMQTLLPLIKGEMSSLLGLAITFSSSDGD